MNNHNIRDNRLPAHNPYIGIFHYGQMQFHVDHPTYLYRHRHNPVVPMMAHAPPTGSLRDLLPVSTVLPLWLYLKPSTDEGWVMVDAHQNSSQSLL
jgi:hypothetical protein